MEPQQDANNSQPTNDNQTQDANPGGNTGTQERTFSQAEVDGLMGKTRKEARDRAITDLLQEIGVEKADELKTLVAEQKKRVEEQLSELEKAQKRATTLEGENQRLLDTLKDVRLRHAIEIEASRQNYNDPADAYQLLDLSAVEIDDDGGVKGAKEALEKLAKEKPYLLKQEQAGQSRNLGTPRQRPAAQGQQPPSSNERRRSLVNF